MKLSNQISSQFYLRSLNTCISVISPSSISLCLPIDITENFDYGFLLVICNNVGNCDPGTKATSELEKPRVSQGQEEGIEVEGQSRNGGAIRGIRLEGK